MARKVERAVNIKITATELDKLKRDLERAGKSGQASLERINKATAPASKGLGTVDRAAAGARKGLDGLATSSTALGGPLGGVSSRAAGLSVVLGKVGIAGLGVGAAITGASVAAKASVSNFADAEQAQKRIEAQLKATGHASGQTLASIEEFSEGLARTTLTDMDRVRSAASSLLTFTNITGEQFTDTLTIAQDLAASGFGTLSSQTVVLAKALSDPIARMGDLGRSGIVLTQSQKDVVQAFAESGQMLEAQAELLSLVRGQVDGAGVGEGEGLVGAFDLLSHEVDILAEALGGKLAPAVDTVLRNTATEIAFISSLFTDDLEGDLAGLVEQLAAVNAELAAADWESTRVAMRGQREEIQTSIDTLKERLAVAADEAVAAKAAGLAKQDEARAEAELVRAQKEAEKTAKKAATAAAALTKRRADAAAKLDVEIAGLERLAAVQGDGEAAIKATEAAIAREAEARRIELSVTDEQYSAFTAELEVRDQLRQTIDDEKQAREAAAEAAKTAADETTKAAEKQADELQRQLERVSDDVVTFATDAIVQVSEGSIKSVGDAMEIIEGTVTRTIARIAAEALLTPIIIPIATTFLGGGVPAGGGASLAGATGMAAGAGGFGAGVARVLSTPVVGGVAAPVQPGLSAGVVGAGRQAGLSLGGLAGYAGAGYFGGQFLAGFTGGNKNRAGIGGLFGSGGGAAFSTALGFGPIPGAIGGGVLGSLLGGTFGGKESDKAAQGVVNLQSGIHQGYTGLGSASQENKDLRQLSLEQAAALVEILSGRGGDTAGLKLSTLVGSRDGLRFNLIKGKGSPVPGDQDGFTDTGSDPVAFLEAINRGILKLTPGLDKLDRTVLKNVENIGDLAEVQSALDFADLYRDLSNTGDATTAARQAIDDLGDSFDAARKQAKAYGLEVDVLNKAQRQARKDLTAGFDDEITSLILAIEDPLAHEMRALSSLQAERLANAEDFGADLVEVERLAALERQAVVKRYAEETAASLGSSFSSFLAELTGSTQYGNSPIVSHEANTDRFNQLRRRALQGDASAEADVEAAARDFLSSSENVNARSTQYFDDRDRVIRTLRRLEADNLAPSEAQRALHRATLNQTDVLRDVGTEVAVTNSRLDRAIDRLDRLVWLGDEERRAGRFHEVAAAA